MFITLALIPIFRSLAVRVNAVDVPNERKVHFVPMPRSGGISMVIGALMPVILWAPRDKFVMAVLTGAVIITLFGLIDDLKNLGFKSKFAGQLVATLIVVLYGGLKIKCLGMLLPDGVFLPDWLSIPLTIFVIVGVINAINLSDGLDGLAGGISLLSFICIGYLAYLGENITIALMSVAITGAIFGFLRFNTFPASVFMGDAGSQLLGFLAVTLSLSLTQANTPLSPILPLIILGFPVLDTLTVMLERILDGRSPFAADKNHFHHKLMRLGLYHTEAVFVIYILQAFLVTYAFIFRFYPDGLHLFLYTIFSGIIVTGFLVADSTGWRLKRFDFVDRVIKGKLKALKEKNILIKLSYRVIETGVPLLLFFTCFLPASVPAYFSFLSMGLIGLITAAWLFKKRWVGGTLRLALYLLIPVAIYLTQIDMAPWINVRMVRLYNLSFGFMVFFLLLVLKFTRRRNGFKVNPMDFLVLFIVLVVPNLPDQQVRSYHMGLIAAEIITLFFSYEVLILELRGNLKKVGLSTIAALVVVSMRIFVF